LEELTLVAGISGEQVRERHNFEKLEFARLLGKTIDRLTKHF
jgi:hypothetical protein